MGFNSSFKGLSNITVNKDKKKHSAPGIDLNAIPLRSQRG